MQRNFICTTANHFTILSEYPDAYTALSHAGPQASVHLLLWAAIDECHMACSHENEGEEGTKRGIVASSGKMPGAFVEEPWPIKVSLNAREQVGQLETMAQGADIDVATEVVGPVVVTLRNLSEKMKCMRMPATTVLVVVGSWIVLFHAFQVIKIVFLICICVRSNFMGAGLWVNLGTGTITGLMKIVELRRRLGDHVQAQVRILEDPTILKLGHGGGLVLGQSLLLVTGSSRTATGKDDRL
ncbi:hypothetical protein FVER53590_02475 [Fusarium verticillioides]|nr:hypothetical protein FVER53590_02475 [Fusarium verticillioides]